MRMQAPPGARTLIDGRLVDYFSGTGYLGLQNHPAVVAAAAEALRLYGVSTATSRGSYGEHPVYDELEAQARAFLGCEAVTYFASGYMGASILLRGELHGGDHLFIDDRGHYSLWDAALLTSHAVTPFRHRDPEALRAVLAAELAPGERPLVLTDGIFPISGEIAPLPDFLRVVEEYDGLVIVDDAHALGVLGENGRGTGDHFRLADGSRLRSCATLAKALGGYGGLIGGPAAWVENLERTSGALIGSSPPPLVVAAASAAGLRVAREEMGLREALWKNVARARQGFIRLGLDVEDTPSPVICLNAEKALNLVRMRTELFDAGIAVSLVRGYTSAPAGGGLRIAIFATHSSEQIDRLILTIKRLI